jgi:hypothetical protein
LTVKIWLAFYGQAGSFEPPFSARFQVAAGRALVFGFRFKA